MSKATADDWKVVAEAYVQASKNTTAKPTSLMLQRLSNLLPFSQASGILDNGSGPGSVMSRLIDTYGTEIPPSCKLSCADWAPAMVDQINLTKKQAIDQDPTSPWVRVDTQVLDALDLHSISDESLSHVAAGWVYHMTKDPQKCLAETVRVLKPGGVLGVASWVNSQWLEAMRPLAKIKPELQPPMGPIEWRDASLLEAELKKAGFHDIEVQDVQVELAFQSHAIFVDILLNMMPPLVALLKGLSEKEVENLRDLMIEEISGLCPQEPGALKATALVAVGRK